MTSSHNEFAHSVLQWFDRHGRHDLPWQHPRTPYRVWVSEIMLQQTQVATVIPYFERFMTAFPTLEALADATEDEVLALWAGLGYYARGRNLRRAAVHLFEEGRRTLPDTLDGLMALPGIGRSTAGAILSMGFGIRAPILDGNVKRVLCRHEAIEGWPGERRVEQQLWGLSESLTPHDRVDDYTQAIMDLGATVCTRSRPACDLCPLRATCQARQKGLETVLPHPRPRRTLPERHATALILLDAEGRCLMEKRPSPGIWGGLWCPPISGWDVPPEQARAQLAARFNVNPEDMKTATGFRHTFSHFHLTVVPCVVHLGVKYASERTSVAVTPLKPVDLSREEKGLPAPFRKWLKQYLAGDQE